MRHELAVGWFLLGAFLLVGVGLVLRPRTQALIATHTLSFELAQGQGLEPGLPVLIHGIPIGELDEVELTPANRVAVSFHVLPEYVENVRADAAIVIVPPPLLGQPTISLRPGRSESPSRRGQVLPASVELGLLAEVKGELSGVVAQVSSLNALATESLTELNVVLRRIEQGQGVAGQLVSDPGLAEDARETLASVRRAAKRIETTGLDRALETLETTQELVEGLADKDGRLQSLLRGLDEAVVDLRSAIKSAKVDETVSTLRRAADSFALTAQQLGKASSEARPISKDLREAMRAMRDASKAFRVLSDELARQPDSVIWGKSAAPGPGLRR